MVKKSKKGNITGEDIEYVCSLIENASNRTLLKFIAFNSIFSDSSSYIDAVGKKRWLQSLEAHLEAQFRMQEEYKSYGKKFYDLTKAKGRLKDVSEINTVDQLVKEVAGEDTVMLVNLLKDQENISEFKLAEKLGLTVNTVRNMLYRLQAHNLVSSIRKKDRIKGGYIYYWTFNMQQAKIPIRIVKQRKLEHLKDRLRSEIQELFYICPQKCVRFKMEHAMDYDFKCPECGNVLEEENNMDFILKIKNTITELEDELSKLPIESKVKLKTQE